MLDVSFDLKFLIYILEDVDTQKSVSIIQHESHNLKMLILPQSVMAESLVV